MAEDDGDVEDWTIPEDTDEGDTEELETIIIAATYLLTTIHDDVSLVLGDHLNR